ncbi:MAG: RNA polymerase sigma factor [Sphaerobacteraceae bacterium]|nr:MAG: RNA polymerase sigma factor [Sphaerobacteraceae bacterium]
MMNQTTQVSSEPRAVTSFETIVQEYEAPIGRYLYSLVGDFELSQDLSQDTFISAYKAYDPQKIHNLSAWLYRIATNKAMSHFRRKKILSWVALDKLIDVGRDPSVESHGEWVATSHSVQQALNQLEPDQRACLLLKASGFSHDEIAEQLGCSPGAARTRLSRARDAFRANYGEDSPTGGGA